MAYKYICSAITTSGKRCKKRNCIIEDNILVSEYCTIHHKMYYMKDNCSICYNEIVNEKKNLKIVIIHFVNYVFHNG